MRAKCYLCGNETDEFAIIETNPEIAVCFDCADKHGFIFTKKAIQEAKEPDKLQQIFEGGETHGNQR